MGDYKDGRSAVEENRQRLRVLGEGESYIPTHRKERDGWGTRAVGLVGEVDVRLHKRADRDGLSLCLANCLPTLTPTSISIRKIAKRFFAEPMRQAFIAF
jgi:hypothetical protein